MGRPCTSRAWADAPARPLTDSSTHSYPSCMQSARTRTSATDALLRLGLSTSLTGVVGGTDAEGNGVAIDVIDPSVGEAFASFKDGDPSVIRAAVESAASAHGPWAPDGTLRA